jgi:hypothetical protein
MKSKTAVASFFAFLVIAAGDASGSTYNVSFSVGTVNVTGGIVTDCDSCTLTHNS